MLTRAMKEKAQDGHLIHDRGGSMEQRGREPFQHAVLGQLDIHKGQSYSAPLTAHTHRTINPGWALGFQCER